MESTLCLSRSTRALCRLNGICDIWTANRANDSKIIAPLLISLVAF
jgi:hypothetical protein